MKYIIVGAGISGLSIGQVLKEYGHDVQLFEADSRPGGMVKCDRVHGHLFHRTGGHVFNTKRQDVLDWFWSHFDKKDEFTMADRNSVVSMADNTIIAYPIENHAYQLSDEMMKNFINDIVLMATNKPVEPTNFEEFLRARFGETLYREYFRPYYEKTLLHTPYLHLERQHDPYILLHHKLGLRDSASMHGKIMFHLSDVLSRLPDRLWGYLEYCIFLHLPK